MRLAANHSGEMGEKPLGNALHTMVLFTKAPERELHGTKQHIAVQEDCVGFLTYHAVFFIQLTINVQEAKQIVAVAGCACEQVCMDENFNFNMYQTLSADAHTVNVFVYICMAVHDPVFMQGISYVHSDYYSI